jgi:hypothetical protein
MKRIALVVSLAAIALGILALGPGRGTPVTLADISPSGCNAQAAVGLGHNGHGPMPVVVHDDILGYQINASNQAPPGQVACLVTNAVISLNFPPLSDGVFVPICTIATLPSGTGPTPINSLDASCPADGAPALDYRVTKASVNPSTGQVEARVRLSGDAHSVSNGTKNIIAEAPDAVPEVQIAWNVTKQCLTPLVTQGQDIKWRITIANKSADVSIIVTSVLDSLPGGSFDATLTGVVAPLGSVSAVYTLRKDTSPTDFIHHNSVTVTANPFLLDPPRGFPTEVKVVANDDCRNPTPTQPPTVNPPISKCTLPDVAACLTATPPNPHVANLWLCQPVASCATPAAGIGERDFYLNLGGPVRGLDPKCLATPTPAPPATPVPCARQSIGSFQFEVRYDSKLISVQVEPGSLWRDAGGNLFSDVSCDRIPTQNGIQFRCNVKGKSHLLDGPGTLAVVKVTATADVYSMLIPNQGNGIVTQLINQDCQLSDLQGHPIKLAGQTLPGFGPAVCDDADVTIRYLEGDVNADCEVNVQDQQLIAFRWGAHLGSLLYNSRYDLEPAAPKKGDGDIDAKDLQAVWGRHNTITPDTCANPHPGQDPVDPKAIPTKQPTPIPTP